MQKKKRRTQPLHFPSVQLTDLPDGHSKHRKSVLEILDHLRKLDEYTSIKIDLAEVGRKKSDLRAALHRAAKKEKLESSTVSDERNLYVFHRKPKTRMRL
ncbi:MAG: hypothetical protein DMG96_35210 [Acidobacteria bacterium]|nr:MAG: hypothetical protein DMG98_22070 [Acidobacteriota bacterium]PYV68964.1 MAG: hypothetical protein DMG96_35210 [Acidobacteriota bacterium]